MDILFLFAITIIFSIIYNILNLLFGFSDDNCEVYYEREIRYEEPPF